MIILKIFIVPSSPKEWIQLHFLTNRTSKESDQNCSIGSRRVLQSSFRSPFDFVPCIHRLFDFVLCIYRLCTERVALSNFIPYSQNFISAFPTPRYFSNCSLMIILINCSFQCDNPTSTLFQLLFGDHNDHTQLQWSCSQIYHGTINTPCCCFLFSLAKSINTPWWWTRPLHDALFKRTNTCKWLHANIAFADHLLSALW